MSFSICVYCNKDVIHSYNSIYISAWWWTIQRYHLHCFEEISPREYIPYASPDRADYMTHCRQAIKQVQQKTAIEVGSVGNFQFDYYHKECFIQFAGKEFLP